MRLKSDGARTDAYYSVDCYNPGAYAPFIRLRRESWQAAYAEARRALTVHDHIDRVQVIRRTHDAYIYRGVRQFTKEG